MSIAELAATLAAKASVIPKLGEQIRKIDASKYFFNASLLLPNTYGMLRVRHIAFLRRLHGLVRQLFHC